MARICTLLIFIAVAVAAQSQRRLLVADLETRKPLPDVLVSLGVNDTLKTAWDGSFIVPDSAEIKHVTLKSPNYFVRDVASEEVTDTLFIIPKGHLINEVVIYGTAPKSNIQGMSLALSPTEAALQSYQPSEGLNILGALAYIIRPFIKDRPSKKERRRQQFKQIMDNY